MKANILKTKSTRYALFHLKSPIMTHLSYLIMCFLGVIKIWRASFMFFCSKDITCLGCVSFKPIDEQTFPQPQVI